MGASGVRGSSHRHESYRDSVQLRLMDELIEDVELSAVRINHEAIFEMPDAHRMAAILGPQALAILQSIRALIGHGYLFGANVLFRPFLERVVIIDYLTEFPADQVIWSEGWSHRDAPSLNKMLLALHGQSSQKSSRTPMTAPSNNLLHGSPDSVVWTGLDEGGMPDFRVDRQMVDRADLCDELCSDLNPWVMRLAQLMAEYFGPPASA